MSLVPIIIPFFREDKKLAKCRAAIQAQTHKECEVFVRDNTHDNVLFTAAVNEGLAKYCYRPEVSYVLVLNQDAYMQQDCLRSLLDFMDAHPECGIACPLQIAEAGVSGSWGGAAAASRSPLNRQVTWGGSLQAFPAGVHVCDEFASYVEPRETYWANGACMLIRTQVVREVGLFDKNMRFICSDADFSFSARARGWKVFVVPGAVAEHGGGASAAGSNREIDLVKCRDALYFARKWLGGDLYRSLSFEGPGLTRAGVRNEIGKLQRMIERLERMLGVSAQPGGLPRWTVKVPATSGRSTTR